MSKTFRFFGWTSAGLLIMLIDQISKHWVMSQLDFQTPVKVNRFFNLYLDFNKGAAFSFLGGQNGWQIWFFSFISLIISLGVLSFFFKTPKISLWRGTALALILGGALGNLIDRILYRYVVDFISWHIDNHYFATFNLADSAVCMGAVLLFFDLSQHTGG